MIKAKPLLTEASDKQIGQEIISQITNGNSRRFGNMMKHFFSKENTVIEIVDIYV